jgi:alkylation response protein AidB-like acyl-CoA dehydrogenase
MDFKFTDEQEMFRKTVRDFVEKECPREVARRYDENKEFPYDFYKKVAQQGWFGLPFPEKYGGSNCKTTDLIIIADALAKYSYDIAAGYAVPMFCAMNILHHGTEEQKKYYLPRFIKGDIRFAISISEPGAGSDAAAVSISATPEGDDYVIRGEKMFTSGAAAENTILTMATRTDKNATSRQKGITVFLLENDLAGFEAKRIDTLGRRTMGTFSIYCDNVRVSKDKMLGKLHDGWNVILGNLEMERTFTGSMYVAQAQSVVDDALAHAKEREQFGRPIGKFQSIAHMLADMQTEVDAARLLVYRAAWTIDQGEPAGKEVSMAKLFASETLMRVATQGMQVMGGYGYCMEYDMQRYFRDAKITTVSAGTSQMQRLIIARHLGL